MRAAINEAWEHGGGDFQSRFDKSTAQAEQMKEGGADVRELARGLIDINWIAGCRFALVNPLFRK
jgi:hypothetical protein